MGDLRHKAGFESFGTRLMFRTNDPDLLHKIIDTARVALLGRLEECEAGPFALTIDVTRKGKDLLLERNGSYITAGEIEWTFFKFLNAIIRVSVGEFNPDLVFLHAGAVAWRGKGIVLPADSFSGKSTLVTELVKRGAEYYSDDFAILDRSGDLHPYPRTISMRTREFMFSVYEVHPDELGATTGDRPIPVGLVLITKYRSRARWAPRILASGEGVLQSVPFALSMGQRPDLCLEVLNRVAASATIATTPRGDAARAADRLLKFFDSTLF